MLRCGNVCKKRMRDGKPDLMDLLEMLQQCMRVCFGMYAQAA